MSTQNYYQILGVSPTATTEEIRDAADTLYNKWRQLVTHQDASIAAQASQALRDIEQIRTILCDPQRRSVYDTGIGIGGKIAGLGDPDAILRQMPPPPAPPTPPPQPREERTDVWVCPSCHTVNAVGTRFCKKCGSQLGRDCPNCGTLAELGAEFCPGCGANIREAIEAKIKAERERQLQPMRELVEGINRDLRGRYWLWIVLSWWLYGVPVAYVTLVWIRAYYRAGQLLDMSPVPGDDEYRARALEARETARAYLTVLWGIIALVAAIAFCVASAV